MRMPAPRFEMTLFKRKFVCVCNVMHAKKQIKRTLTWKMLCFSAIFAAGIFLMCDVYLGYGKIFQLLRLTTSL